MRLFFVKNGEVELSKKIVNKNPSMIQYVDSTRSKKNDRVIVARKSANDCFGEVEILQKIPRFTRALCISPRLEVYYITGNKLLTNLNVEGFLAHLKRCSEMIHSWRDKQYKRMAENVYNLRDPLN